jgi:hypothetical protein
MKYFKPNRTIINIFLILGLIHFSSSILSSVGSYFISKNSVTKLENATEVKFQKELKALGDELNNRSIEGMRYRKIHFHMILGNAFLSILLLVVSSYVGACIIWNTWIKTKDS